MTLDANQIALIGTKTSQSTYKLHVNENSHFNGTTSASSMLIYRIRLKRDTD